MPHTAKRNRVRKVRCILGLKWGLVKVHRGIAALGVLALFSACASAGGGPAPAPAASTPVAGAAMPTKEVAMPAKDAATPAPSATSISASAAQAREIRVTLKDRSFPKEIRVKVGEKVVFVITNEASEVHSFEFPDLNVYEEIQPGRTGRIEWSVPDKKGKWDMGCFLTSPEDAHVGMEGLLVIE